MTMRLSAIATLALAGLLATGCGDTTSPRAEEVVEEVEDVMDAAEEYAQEQRDRVEERLERDLRYVGRAVDELQARPDAEARAAADELRLTYVETLEKFEALTEAGEEHWETLKGEVDSAISVMKRRYEKLQRG